MIEYVHCRQEAIFIGLYILNDQEISQDKSSWQREISRLHMINEGMKNPCHVPAPDESSSSLPDKDNENDAGIANTLPKAAKSCRLTNF